jgi:hypothetical protein
MPGEFHVTAVEGSDRYVMFERDGIVALAERGESGFSRPGSPGIVGEQGFATLVWRGAQAFFVARDFEQPATAEQIETVRRFSADLEERLRQLSAS